MGLVGLSVRRLSPSPLVLLRIGCGVETKWLSLKLKRAWAKGVSLDDLLLLAARPSSKATGERRGEIGDTHSTYGECATTMLVGSREGGSRQSGPNLLNLDRLRAEWKREEMSGGRVDEREGLD